MTLDIYAQQVAAVGLAYAVALLEQAPAHWVRPGLLHDLRTLLEQLTGEENSPALKVTRGHVKKLKEPQTH